MSAEAKAKKLLQQALDMETKWQLEVGRLLNAHHPTFSTQKEFLRWCAIHLNISRSHAYRLMAKARNNSTN